jgi:hypothetical protein
MRPDGDRPRDTESASSSGAFGAPAFVALLPASVVALGSAKQPVDRLMALQSAVARGVDLVTQAGRLRLSLSAHGWPRLQLR